MPLSPVHKIRTPASAARGKYPQLVEHLVAEIRAGKLRDGDKLPTFVEMQEQFGVTPHTVNRAMIALEHRGLVERRRGSGIFVSLRRPKNRGGTGIIGLAGFGFQFGGQSSYWTTLLSGVREAAARDDRQILLLDYASSQGWEKADGVLICDWTGQETLRHVPPYLPCVSVLVEVEGMSSVVADDYAGARAAVEHLLQLGHTRIGYLHGPPHTATSRRLAAYHDTLREAGIEPLEKWRSLLLWEHDHAENYVRAGQSSMARWLRHGWDKTGCTALLCQNDATAIGAVHALREAAIRVPQDLSLAGFDGGEIGEHCAPRLTTVQLPLREIGARAVSTLIKRIAGDKALAQHDFLKPQLQVRQSTSAPSPC
jgi:DNA-binding LacI/PurR family transcriptional regulator